MNIYLVDYKNPLNNTGLNSYVSILKTYLPKENHINVHFIWVNSEEYTQETIKIIEEVEHIHIPYDITNKGKIHTIGNRALNFITEAVKKKDNIIFHFNWINHTPFAQLLKREIKCRTLLTLHCISWRELVITHYSLFTKINQYLKQRKELSFIFKNYLSKEVMYYDSVDHIISVTNDAKNVLKILFGIPQKKITTIYNGVDIPIKINKTKQELREKYGFSEEEKIILYAGRITESKGVLELLKAFQILIEKYPIYKYRIIICGLGKYDLLYKNIEKYSQITITGNVEKEKLYDFYKLSDIGVIPSYVEQCSYTAIEMMVNKLPIIVTNVGGLDELIDEETGLKVSINFNSQKIIFDIDDLVEKMYYATVNTDMSKIRIERAYQKTIKELSSKKMVEKTLQVYKKIIISNEKIKSQYSDLVSVIIPYYNDEKYIERCLQSVLDQSYSNIEIILIDDGSQEILENVLYRFKDERIKIYRNKENKGIVFCLNKAIRLSQGKYIARLDADDFMHKDRIMQQVDFLEQNHQYAVVGSNHILIDEQENILRYVSFPEENKEILFYKYFFNPISHPTTLFRATIFNEFQYDEEYLYCEDYLLWFRISEKYKIANIPQYTTYFRLHSESVSSKNKEIQQENMLLLLLNELEQQEFYVSDDELKTYIAVVTKQGKQYFNSLEKKEKLKKCIYKLSKHFELDKTVEEGILQYCDIW